MEGEIAMNDGEMTRKEIEAIAIYAEKRGIKVWERPTMIRFAKSPVQLRKFMYPYIDDLTMMWEGDKPTIARNCNEMALVAAYQAYLKALRKLLEDGVSRERIRALMENPFKNEEEKGIVLQFAAKRKRKSAYTWSNR